MLEGQGSLLELCHYRVNIQLPIVPKISMRAQKVKTIMSESAVGYGEDTL